jgi:hypothetical protein
MLRQITLVFAVALLVLASTARVVARQGGDLVGVEDDAYESPTWGYTVAWDEDRWAAVLATSAEDVDLLVLQSRRSSLALQAGPFHGGPDDCVDAVAAMLSGQEDVDDWEPLEDEDGEPVAGERGGRAWAAFALSVTDAAGEEVEGVDYIECRTLVEDEAVLMVVHGTTEDAYAEEAERVDEVLDTLELPDPEETESGPGRGGVGQAGGVDCEDLAAWIDDSAPRIQRAYEITQEIPALSTRLGSADFVAAMKGYAAEFAAMAAEQGNSDPPAGLEAANQELATTFANYAYVVGEIANMLEYSAGGGEIDNATLTEFWGLLPKLTTYLGVLVAQGAKLADDCGIEL